MFNIDQLNQIPENTIVISGEQLQTRRHLSVPPNMTAVIRKPQDPGHLYEILREEYPAGHHLQLVRKENQTDLSLEALIENKDLFAEADYLIIFPLAENRSFETFQNTVAILRGPNGCPWDKKQTHQSIRSDFLQEAYELLDGLDRANNDMIIEELGDVLFHVILQTQMGIDNGEFNMGDVISYANEKIISRHVHVFGSPEEITPDQVTQRWEQIKQKEREKQHKKGGLLDGISRSMPALSMAYSYQVRAAKTGFEWENEADLWEKLAEELDEFQKAETYADREAELGDILFCIVNLSRWYKIDPETALRTVNAKFYDRVHYIEEQAAKQQKTLFDLPREEKGKYWNEYKAEHCQE